MSINFNDERWYLADISIQRDGNECSGEKKPGCVVVVVGFVDGLMLVSWEELSFVIGVIESLMVILFFNDCCVEKIR